MCPNCGEEIDPDDLEDDDSDLEDDDDDDEEELAGDE